MPERTVGLDRIPPPERGPVKSSGLAVFESCVGTFFCTVLLLGTGMLLALFGFEGYGMKRRDWLVWGVLALGWLALDLPYTLGLWARVWRGRHPSALTLALDRLDRRMPLLIRLASGVWWFAHTAMALLVLLL